jgi:hypothetical protein
MPQAEATLTTRRGFSKWLAGVGLAMAAPGSLAAAAPAPRINWSALETELRASCKVVTDLDAKIEAAVDAVARWKKRNPHPVEPDYDSHRARTEDFDRLTRSRSKNTERYIAVLWQSGKGALQTQRKEALAEYYRKLDAVAAIPVRTLSDLKAKTRLAFFEHADGPIHQALLRDLQSCEA